MTDSQIDERLEAFSKEALAECARLRCRNHGDCDSACRYFYATATEGEKEAATRADEKFKRWTRGWNGSVMVREP